MINFNKRTLQLD